MLSPNGHGAALSERERAVLAAAASGLGVAEVAERLGLSVEAVRRSITSAITELGARSKLDAVVIALRRGLITLSVV
jgi:two-component system, NarL family, nitrate/nitrite response regulator NarL